MFSKLLSSLTILALALSYLSTAVTTVSAAPRGSSQVLDAALPKGLSPEPEVAPGVQPRYVFPTVHSGDPYPLGAPGRTFGRPLARDAEVGLNAEGRSLVVSRNVAEPRWVPNGKQPTTGRPRDLNSLIARELAEIRDIIPDETAVMGANGVVQPW